ncbi:Retinol dehydrogenase 8 [Holothuria leucospilota]|uniref:Retinol dehydrogenase 8 n=1 Tax=Holothuria leucospilota TaxID=206669 RepID=A0A9Q1H505_HOLLE|nr:Retinol dehydrogenase 8 [Holothuria leucospilota]
MSNENSKVIVITGCSSGIGLETAVLLAKEKDCKVIATMRNLKKKEALEKAAGNNLNRSLFIEELDISKEESILKFVKETINKEGQIDVLINNAAMGQIGKFEDVSLQQMQNLFQTNFFGTVRITQEVVRKMKEKRSGKIIFVSSLAGIEPFLFGDFYISTKFAIEGLVGCIAPLMRTFNISITSVQPGPVKTEFQTNISQNKQGSLSTEDEIHDAETKALMGKAFEKFMAALGPGWQTGKDVAEVIKKCVQNDKPDLRVATSDFVQKRGEAILVDYSGNTLTETLANTLI